MRPIERLLAGTRTAALGLTLALGLGFGDGGVVAAAQTLGTVQVTVPRANVREAPTLDSRVVTQVTAGTTMDLQAIEGDWYKVRLAMGGIRVEAYIAKSVSKLIPPDEPAAGRGAGAGAAAGAGGRAAPAGGEAAAAAGVAVARAGMSVALQRGGDTDWIPPSQASVRIAPGRRTSLPSAIAALPPAGAQPPAGGAPATFVWVLPTDAPSLTIADAKRPSFIAQFKDVPGVPASGLAAAIVRLSPAGDAGLVVAAVPGRADQAIWGDADWDVMRNLEQDVVRAAVEPLEPGAVRVTPSSDLAPGAYAVVIRPLSRDRLAGNDVLTGRGHGQVFETAFVFRIQ